MKVNVKKKEKKRDILKTLILKSDFSFFEKILTNIFIFEFICIKTMHTSFTFRFYLFFTLTLLAMKILYQM
jgi:hypothetical protein